MEKVEYNGLWFDEGTAPEVMELIHKLYMESPKRRVRFFLGDPVTGRDRHERYNVKGYVGACIVEGKKVPALNIGSSQHRIQTKCVIKVQAGRYTYPLYEHPKYNNDLKMVPGEDGPNGYWNVVDDMGNVLDCSKDSNKLYHTYQFLLGERDRVRT